MVIRLSTICELKSVQWRNNDYTQNQIMVLRTGYRLIPNSPQSLIFMRAEIYFWFRIWLCQPDFVELPTLSYNQHLAKTLNVSIILVWL